MRRFPMSSAFLAALFYTHVIVTLTEGPVTVSNPANELTITASPNEIFDQFTPNLTVNCKFSPQQTSDFATVMSVILSKDTKELAALTSLHRNTVDVKDSLGAQVTGSLPQQGEAYISYIWSAYPSADAVTGNYSCAVQGMDSFGHVLVSSVVVEVREKFVDNQMVQDALLQKIKELETKLQNQKTEQDQKVTELETKQDKKVNDLESKLNAQTTKLNGIISQVEGSRSAVIEASTSYNGHTYYLSRPVWDTITAMDGLCRLYGGYLAEVDNSSELHVLQTFVRGHSVSQRGVFVGGTDEDQEGVWRYRRSGRRLTYLGRNGGGTKDNCLTLWRDSNRALEDWTCYTGEWARFLCEVPK